MTQKEREITLGPGIFICYILQPYYNITGNMGNSSKRQRGHLSIQNINNYFFYILQIRLLLL
jgi:hypothetical protein